MDWRNDSLLAFFAEGVVPASGFCLDLVLEGSPISSVLSEKLVKLQGRSATAAFSPSGLSLNELARRFHRALLQELAHGNHERLGLAAQAVYTASVAFPELLSMKANFARQGVPTAP